MLDWIENPALRRRVSAGLNKGEARNSLARAVFFNRLGDVRDRSFENQRHRASGLNLVVAAVTLWNTVYRERAAEQLAKPQTLDRKRAKVTRTGVLRADWPLLLRTLWREQHPGAHEQGQLDFRVPTPAPAIAPLFASGEEGN